MLIAEPKTPSGGRQIVASGTTVNQVVYAVPQNHTFVGYVTLSSASSFLLNGVSIYLAAGQVLPLTLLGGGIIAASGVQVSIVGVEQ